MYYPIFTAYLIYYICFIFYYLYKYRKSIPVEQVRGLAICILFVYTGFIAQVYFFGYVLLVNIFFSDRLIDSLSVLTESGTRPGQQMRFK